MIDLIPTSNMSYQPVQDRILNNISFEIIVCHIKEFITQMSVQVIWPLKFIILGWTNE
jgi:hypothetical protein